MKDESVRGDGVYKSHTIAVGSGEAPNSGELKYALECGQLLMLSSVRPDATEKAKGQEGPQGCSSSNGGEWNVSCGTTC